VNEHPLICDCLDCMNAGGGSKLAKPPVVRRVREPAWRNRPKPDSRAWLLTAAYAKARRRWKERAA
jgi:hypothetical protein